MERVNTQRWKETIISIVSFMYNESVTESGSNKPIFCAYSSRAIIFHSKKFGKVYITSARQIIALKQTLNEFGYIKSNLTTNEGLTGFIWLVDKPDEADIEIIFQGYIKNLYRNKQ